MENIVQYTNKNMQSVIDKFSDLLDGPTKYSNVRLADRVGIEAFIGILYLRAALRLNILDREVIWNHESAHNIIGATISLHRFKFICPLITLMRKKLETNVGRLRVWEIYFRTWMKGMKEWGILLPC